MAIIDDFRESAIPRLREACKVQAFFAALGLIEPSEGRSEIATLAWKLGAGLLPAKHQDRLFDQWISEVFWDELNKAHDRIDVINARAEQAIKDDPVRYYEGLATRCSRPELMRWVFASICPPYRKHLIQERRNARKA